MRISRAQKICGIPAFDLRKAFRASGGVVTDDWLAYRLKISPTKASKLIKDLLHEGYIEKQKPGSFGYIGWDLTVQGNALSNASAAKPLSRKAAERKVAEFLERIKAVRDDANFLYKAKHVFVFGSFLSNQEQIGDIDLAIELVAKETDQKKFKNLCLRKINEARKHGRHFSNIIEEYAWPEHEVLMALKARSRSVSLHRFDPEWAKMSKHVLLYSEPDS
jgi:DNA-binding Lrp family transcriptional regulator